MSGIATVMTPSSAVKICASLRPKTKNTTLQAITHEVPNAMPRSPARRDLVRDRLQRRDGLAGRERPSLRPPGHARARRAGDARALLRASDPGGDGPDRRARAGAREPDLPRARAGDRDT